VADKVAERVKDTEKDTEREDMLERDEVAVREPDDDVEAEELGESVGHSMRMRACGAYSGFGKSMRWYGFAYKMYADAIRKTKAPRTIRGWEG